MNGYDNSVITTTQAPPSEATVQKRRPSNRVLIQNLPAGVTQEAVDRILTDCGTVKKTIVNAETGGVTASVIFDTPEEAQKAVDKLNNSDYEGSTLKAEIMTNNPANGRSNRSGNAAVGGGVGVGRGARNPVQSTANRGTGYPLRILVPSEYVGAIIGRKGSNIRAITTRCKARVDVHGKENSGLVEKVISIFGQPENCTAACKEILLLMQQEATTNQRVEVILKVLADDRFCGRIIGKEGKFIKKIRDDTSTKITVSNAQEMAALFPDRVICVRGGVEGMSQAEAAISGKLAECMDQEMQQQQQQQQQQQHQGGGMLMMGGGGHYAGYYPNSRASYDGYYAPPLYSPPMGGGHPGAALDYRGVPPAASMGGGPAGASGAPIETCQIAVPSAAVGAIIGTAGVNIKQMMRDSGATITIETKKEGDSAVERIVSVRGTADSGYRASYLIFEKLKMEGFGGVDDVRLRTILRIPKTFVGRVIGKAGKNVREMQRVTGAMLRLPEDQASQQGDDVAVEVYGNFVSTQAALRQVRDMVARSQQAGGSLGEGAGSNGPPSATRGGAPRRTGSQDARLLVDGAHA